MKPAGTENKESSTGAEEKPLDSMVISRKLAEPGLPPWLVPWLLLEALLPELAGAEEEDWLDELS